MVLPVKVGLCRLLRHVVKFCFVFDELDIEPLNLFIALANFQVDSFLLVVLLFE